MSAAGAVAAIHGKIVRAFANANAFSEPEAKSKEELGLRRHGRGMFQRMVQRGDIIETADGRYYMDKAYYDARMRKKRIAIPILLGVAVCAIIWAIISFR